MRLIQGNLLSNSRSLRKNQTPWESKIWQRLRAHRFFGLGFKRQVQIGNYIVDFCCRGKSLIVELDGGQHSEDKVVIKDNYKQKYLESQGYKVLHFWNNDVDNNLDGVLEVIRIAAGSNPSPALPSEGERGNTGNNLLD